MKGRYNMNILVINGSPKRDKSDCMKLTYAFLEGMGQKADVLHAIDCRVNPCAGCYACWQPAGVCPQEDDMAGILRRITSSDMVIFSFPLYCYGMPGPLKMLIDRVLPLSTREQRVDADGRTYHPSKEEHEIRFMMISGCGFPNIEHNYEGVIFQFGMLFGEDCPRITCAEAPLLSIPDAKPLAEGYIALVRQAGQEYMKNGRISDDTQKRLDTPMFDPDTYRRMSSGN